MVNSSLDRSEQYKILHLISNFGSCQPVGLTHLNVANLSID